MATGLKITFQMDQTSRYIWLTDKTGEYDLTTNPTGHGAPNFELNQSALVVSFIRNASAGAEKLSAASFDVLFDAGATNDKETVFQFNFLMDGYHTATVFRLPVSTDDTNTIDTAPVALSEGDYYYRNVGGAAGVYKIEGGSPVPVTDYEDMVGNVDITQISCEEVFFGKLPLKEASFYKEYRRLRDKYGIEYKDADKVKKKQEDIQLDIRNSYRNFRGGNGTVAQDIIETAIERYDIK